MDKVEIVVSRYEEDLSWLNEEPFNKYAVCIYNKGGDMPFLGLKQPHKIIQISNLGNCDYTYLYHIVNNYDNNGMADITVFLPGSLDVFDYKKNKARKLIHRMEASAFDKSVFIFEEECRDVREKYANFTITHWGSRHPKNIEKNVKMHNEKYNILTPCEKRPFGNWYAHHFNGENANYVSLWGEFIIKRAQIKTRSREFYESFLEEVCISYNPEVGHYLERAWQAVFGLTHENSVIVRS